jgi:hypothetical protein
VRLKTTRPRRWWVIGSDKSRRNGQEKMRSRPEVIKGALARDETLVSRRRNWIHASASAMRDHIDQPKARKAQQADKDQGNGVYDHAMPIIILAFWAFVFREVSNR